MGLGHGEVQALFAGAKEAVSCDSSILPKASAQRSAQRSEFLVKRLNGGLHYPKEVPPQK